MSSTTVWLAVREFGVPAAIIVLLVIATVTGRDLWPFSHYPMFAGQPGGDAVRYFRIRFELSNGRCVTLRGHAETLADAFHRELEALCGECGEPSGPWDEIAVRYWRAAARLDPTLKEARAIEVTKCVARVIRGKDVLIGEQKLGAIPIPSAAR